MSNRPIDTILVIAGSDSGGGAGIQGDIKTITCLGGYATTAITALTAQNTTDIYDIVAIDASFVATQIDCVLQDIGTKSVKTGMLYNAEIVEVVASKLASLKKQQNVAIVVDPVMTAKNGTVLLSKDAIASMCKQLIPLATVVTPNIPEAEMLSSTLISNTEGMINAGRRIQKNMGCDAVLIKGGHMQTNMITDILVMGDLVQEYCAPRIDSKHTHGTGCCLSSAIATYMAKGQPLPIAIENARAYLQQALQNSPHLGKGYGPLGHNWQLSELTG